jgi:glycosyltransferase involved in cell wall biosynthesis
MIEYGSLFEELSIILITSIGCEKLKYNITDNTIVYPTDSSNKLSAFFTAYKIALTVVAAWNPFGFGKDDWNTHVITSQDPFETGLVGLLVAKKFGVRLNTQIHTDFLDPFFLKEHLLNVLRMYIARYVLLRSDTIRVVSNRIYASLVKNPRFNVLEKKISILPIWVDRVRYTEAQIKVDLHKKYSQFERIILIASRITKEKNIPFSLVVFKGVVELFPKTGLVIVGKGVECDNIKQIAKKLSIDSSVVFEGWSNDLVSYYKSSDMFLVSSLYEGYGMTIVEAIASGTPVVSTDVGIAREVMPDWAIYQQGDAKACIQIIKRLFNSGGYDIRPIPIQTKQEYLELYKKFLSVA